MTAGLFDPRTGETWNQPPSVVPERFRSVTAPRVRTPTPTGPSIDERFTRFHQRHPEVYGALVVLARQARSHGRRYVPIEMLWQTLRWNSMIAGLPDPIEKYSLNDHYRSRFARLIMEQEPDLRGMFKLRALRSA